MSASNKKTFENIVLRYLPMTLNVVSIASKIMSSIVFCLYL